MEKHDNLVKLMDGLSLLDEQDQERVIKVVDTLDFTDKNIKNEILDDKMGYMKKESKAQFARD